MATSKLVSIILIIGGALALAFGSFTYTKETHDAKLGPMEISIKDKETVNIPAWAGGAAIVVGLVLLVVRTKN